MTGLWFRISLIVIAVASCPIYIRDCRTLLWKNMIYGPCGSWCFNEGKCSKEYPKKFRPETILDENGYPYYLRTDTGIRYHRYDGYTLDNTNVLPHSPMFLQLLNCHINSVVVSRIKAVKYFYKYFTANIPLYYRKTSPPRTRMYRGGVLGREGA